MKTRQTYVERHVLWAEWAWLTLNSVVTRVYQWRHFPITHRFSMFMSYTVQGQSVETDWHVPVLYNFNPHPATGNQRLKIGDKNIRGNETCHLVPQIQSMMNSYKHPAVVHRLVVILVVLSHQAKIHRHYVVGSSFGDTSHDNCQLRGKRLELVHVVVTFQASDEPILPGRASHWRFLPRLSVFLGSALPRLARARGVRLRPVRRDPTTL